MPFLRTALAALARLVRASGAALVLSSTWRMEPRRVEALRAALAASGVGAEALVGATPVLRGGGGRSAEVLAWLASHPKVTRWAVVDDEGAAFRAEAALEGRLLLTASEAGLTESIADHALAALLRK